MADPLPPAPPRLIVALGGIGAALTFMGGAAGIFVLRGGLVRYRGGHLSIVESALLALFLLGLGLVLLRAAVKMTPPIPPSQD